MHRGLVLLAGALAMSGCSLLLDDPLPVAVEGDGSIDAPRTDVATDVSRADRRDSVSDALADVFPDALLDAPPIDAADDVTDGGMDADLDARADVLDAAADTNDLGVDATDAGDAGDASDVSDDDGMHDGGMACRLTGTPPCPMGTFCNFPRASCGMGGVIGMCIPIGGPVCTGIARTVCGCNHVTYDNPCFAAAASQSIDRDGPCDDAGTDAGRDVSDSGPTCPIAPVLLYPLSGAVMNTQTNIPLRWKDANACALDGWTVQIADSRDFAGSIFSSSVPVGDAVLNFSPTSPTPRTLFWRVCRGRSTTCSTTSEFRIPRLSPLPMGSLAAPAVVSLMPDVNGDGIADLVLGIPSSDTAAEGRVVWYRGGPTQSFTTPTGALTPTSLGLTMLLGPARQGFGARVTPLGDATGDGIPDILVATGTDYYVILRGGPTGSEFPSGDVRALPPDLALPSALIPPVAGVGDFDGDGQGDVAMLGTSATGTALAIDPRRRESGLLMGSHRVQPAPPTVAWTSLSPVGDIDHDGFADILVGRPGSTPNTLAVLSGATPMSPMLTLRDVPISRGAFIGVPLMSVNGLGDFDGDRVPDFGWGSTSEVGIQSGQTLSLLTGYALPTSDAGPQLATVAFAGTGSLLPEVVIVVRGSSLAEIFTLVPRGGALSTSERVMADLPLRAFGSPGDLNADGIDDLVLTTSFSGAGTLYVMSRAASPSFLARSPLSGVGERISIATAL